MNTSKFGSLVGLIVLGAAFSSAACARDASAEKDILFIEKALSAAKTADPVEKYIDPGIVLYDLMPPTFNGIAAWRGQMAGLAAAFKNFKIEILKIDIKADRELAVANSEQHFTVLDEKGAAIAESTYRVTDCYHKVNGRWLLFSVHESYPVDLATGKVVLNPK